MYGTVISDCKSYLFDENLEQFDLNLPQPTKKDNTIHVLLPKSYPYRPSIDDTVQITGTLITYDEKESGLQTYLLVISLFKCNKEQIISDENMVSIIGRVFKKDKLCKTLSGVAIQRVSISPNTRGSYKPIHCIGYQNSADSLNLLNKKDMVEISGRLISRSFLYRENHYRETTELIVDYVYPIYTEKVVPEEDAVLMNGQLE